MATYETGFSTGATVTAAAICDLRTSASVVATVVEVGFFLDAATTSFIGIYRPSTVGTASTTVTGVPLDTRQPNPTALVGTAWSVAPAVSSNVPLRKIKLPANIGAGVVLAWEPGELMVPVSSSLLIWNYGGTTNSVINGYIKHRE